MPRVPPFAEDELPKDPGCAGSPRNSTARPSWTVTIQAHPSRAVVGTRATNGRHRKLGSHQATPSAETVALNSGQEKSEYQIT
jgi:hypothetical protein